MTSIPLPLQADRRIDLHNAVIHQSSAELGLCGMTDLTTGRVCRAQSGHPDGCTFVRLPG